MAKKAKKAVAKKKTAKTKKNKRTVGIRNG